MQLSFLRKVKLSEKAFFVQQLSVILDAGIPLLRGISMLAEQTRNPLFKEIIQDLYTRLQEGYQLSEAMTAYPKVFPPLYIAVIKSGEATGKLSQVLKELATQQQEEVKFRSGIMSALMYPALIIFAMLVLGFYLVFKVIPQIATLFEENEAQLPLATKILIGTVNFLIGYWYIIIIILVVAIVFIRYWSKTYEGQLFFARLEMKLPVIKNLITGIYVTRFARTTSMLIRSGVPILDTVDLVGASLSNVLYSNSMKIIRESLERGLPMSKPINENPVFPAFVGQMVMVGEQTGKVDETLMSIADYYQGQTNDMIKGLSALIEPVLIIILGVGVGFIVFAVFLPLYEISNIM
jgi:type II secretory pathway component PulF